MKILIINGKPRTGKTTFCDAAIEKRGLVYQYSTVDEVKKLARLLGWNGIKDGKGRKFLSDLKDALTEYNDLPRKHIIKQIEKRLELYKDEPIALKDMVIFIHSREPDDIEKWREYGAKAILIKGNIDLDSINWNNHADDEVFDCIYDYVIDNTQSLREWRETAAWFVDEIRKEDWESHI